MMYYINLVIYYITYPFRELMYNPLKVLSGPKKLLSLSLPVRVALLVAFFLVLIVVFAFVSFLYNRDAAGYEVWLEPKRVVLILVLMIAIPVVVWQAMRLWLEGNVSAYPDIDFAWKAGLAALKEHGVNPNQLPIFLVLGNRDEKQAAHLFKASQLPLRVAGAPEGPAALHWYATPDAVFVCCTESSWLSRVAALGADAKAAPAPTPYSPGPASSGGIRGTIVAGGADDPAERPGRGIRDTAVSGGESSGGGGPAPGGRANPAIYGTMVAGGGIGQTMYGGDAPVQAPALTGVSIAEANEQRARLHYVCELLVRLRQPVCPLNGVLTLLPFEMIQRGVTEGQAVQRAAKGDLSVVFQTTQLRCSVVALVCGLEAESGFRELVRRVGPDRARANRFGKGFNLWNPPIPEQIEAVSTHACGAFEDWAYTLFRERDGLKKHGNTKLYSLLCKVRSRLTERLGNILADAYALDSDNDGDGRETLLFSGVYFAATGESEDRQAFVKGVFDKLMAEESELDWTDQALLQDERYQNLANAMTLVTACLLVALGGMFLYTWFGAATT